MNNASQHSQDTAEGRTDGATTRRASDGRSVENISLPRWHFEPTGTIRENHREDEAFSAASEFGEAPQNAADVRNNIQKPVRQRIHLRRFSSDVLSKWIGDLRRNHQACSTEDPRRYTHDFHDNDGLVLLFEDFNTTGLLGPLTVIENSSDFPENFVGLMRSSGDVVNKGADKLGSRGQGKITFSTASAARCWFAYSVRIPHETPNPEPRVLMGRVRLRPHWLDGKSLSKDGLWAVWNLEDSDVQPYPCTNDALIDDFVRDFECTRQRNEPGTSVVIPHYAGPSEPADLMFYLIEKNYGLIGLNRVEFDVSLEEHGYRCDLRATNIQDVVSGFAESTGDEKWSHLLTRIKRFTLMLAMLNNPNSHIRLPKPERPMPFTHYLRSLPDDIQKQLVDGYEQNVVQVLQIDVEVEETPKEGSINLLQGKLALAVFKDEDPSGDYPEYFRDGLRIAKADRANMGGVRRIAGHGAIVMVTGGKDNGLQMLLRAAEPGAHDEWSDGTYKFKQSWKNGKIWIEFAKRAPESLVEFVKSNTNTLNTSGFKFLVDPNPDGRPDGGNSGSSDDTSRGRNRRTRRPRPKPRPNKPQPNITSHVHNGQKCVRVTLGGLTSRRIAIEARYAREDGSGYNKADFDFGRMKEQGEIVVPGGRVIEALENQLVVECDDKDTFEVVILGFDIRRQPVITADSVGGAG